jgi:hypothetical protein
MENLPLYIPVLFVITTLLTFFFVVKAFHFSKIAMIILLAWLMLQAVIASTGFYTSTSSLPPRFILAIVPPFAAIMILFASVKGRKLIDSLPAGTLTLLHIVRLPVELVLLMLFIQKTIPVEMTFEGRNFDILSGISAPLIYYFGFVNPKLKPAFIIAWNILCVLLLVNIVITAILSVQFPFQQFGFDQPNIAVLNAPYVWLPCFIVPSVLFAHLVVLKQMSKANSTAG